jgi:hypothetical protein
MKRGYFVKGLYLVEIAVFSVIIMSSLLGFSKKKKSGYFDPGSFLIRIVLYSLIVQ